MSSPGQEFVEVFLQEASEHLQFLREYAGLLLDPYPAQDDLERLYVAAHTLKGSSGMYGFPLFSEVSAKLAHIFQYAMNVGIGPDAANPLVEFISEAVAVLESDLWMISAGSGEAADDVAAFKAKYPFAFPAAEPVPEPFEEQQEPILQAQVEMTAATLQEPVYEPVPDVAEEESPQATLPEPSADVSPVAAPAEEAAEPILQGDITLPYAAPTQEIQSHHEGTVPAALSDTLTADTGLEHEQTQDAVANSAEKEPQAEVEEPHAVAAAQTETPFELPDEGEVPEEILEFFVPEVEEHMQVVTECLLSLEANPNEQDIHRLFRAMHTIKGSAAQVGLPRIALVAHRAEDLVGRLRDGQLKPSGNIVDLCLESVDTLKKFLYRQWEDQETARNSTSLLLRRIAALVPEEEEEQEGAEAPAPVVEPITKPQRPLESLSAPESEPLFLDELPAAVPATFEHTGFEELVPPTSSRETPVEREIAASARPEKPAPVPKATRLEEPGAIAEPVESKQQIIAKAAESAAPKTPEVAAVAVTPVPSAQDDAKTAEGSAEVDAIVAQKKESSAVPQSRSVRIALERLDRMMNAVGELVINRTRMLGRVAELERLADVLNFSKARMSDKITEFQEKYEFSRITGVTPSSPAPVTWESSEAFPFRGGYSSYSQKFDASLAEFSELEMDRYDEFSILSRSLTEISADITEILTQLDGFVRRVDSDIDEFTKLAHRLQDEITAARMVPIGNLYTRISRTVRDAAKAVHKQVELQLAGAETELDNNIIQQIADPLLHLVRNAVAHGIERAEERYEAGKPDNGNISVRAYHRGNHIYIEVEDDGRGLDYQKIRSTAVELGLVPADEADRLSERDLQDLLFHPGFSTAPRKTELAGRGVGLDVVRSNLNALSGEIEIESQKGFGTRFTLKVPLTLIISQALFVRCGRSTFAFPLAFVEEIRRIRENEMEEVGGKLLTKVRDVVTEIVRLDQHLGLPPIEPLNGYFRLVIVNVAGRQVGIVVEEVLRKDEIVIKNLGEYLRNVKMFPGATIAPDGSLILMIDVNRLVAGEAIERRPLSTAANAARLFFPGASALASGEVPSEAIDHVPEEKVIVLADDSISVRKFVGRMLEKAGYRVRLACDGLEALEIVSQTRCDLVVTDLEMPRTNGYELMAHLHSNPETSHLPVMVVTSRAGLKHRDKAMKQGAVEFLVKPVQEEQFVATVERLIGAAGSQKPPLAQSPAHGMEAAQTR